MTSVSCPTLDAHVRFYVDHLSSSPSLPPFLSYRYSADKTTSRLDRPTRTTFKPASELRIYTGVGEVGRGLGSPEEVSLLGIAAGVSFRPWLWFLRACTRDSFRATSLCNWSRGSYICSQETRRKPLLSSKAAIRLDTRLRTRTRTITSGYAKGWEVWMGGTVSAARVKCGRGWRPPSAWISGRRHRSERGRGPGTLPRMSPKNMSTSTSLS
ncbi:hypothetical protein GY45DRAFT_424203 [Cubamyces sp. BRFM 1775]|nr:hypothetical protein GY45DRAFT_424203 [Cubamyces sp. BRFM 1775]